MGETCGGVRTCDMVASLRVLLTRHPRVRSQEAMSCVCAPSRRSAEIGLVETSEKHIIIFIAMCEPSATPPWCRTARNRSQLYVVLDAWKQISSMSSGRLSVHAFAIWIARATGRPRRAYLIRHVAPRAARRGRWA